MAELQRESLHTSLESTKKERRERSLTLPLYYSSCFSFVCSFGRRSAIICSVNRLFVRMFDRPFAIIRLSDRLLVRLPGRPSATTRLVDRLFVCLFFSAVHRPFLARSIVRSLVCSAVHRPLIACSFVHLNVFLLVCSLVLSSFLLAFHLISRVL